MANDWKDALEALKGSLPVPEDKEIKNTIETKSEVSQKEPLYVVTDKKGRNGKTATIIEGFIIPEKEVEKIARMLKQKLGVGGSVREGEILIQGDHKETIKKFLTKLNFKVK